MTTIGPPTPTQFFGSSTADLIASIGLCKGNSGAGMNSSCSSLGQLAQTMCRMGGVAAQGIYEKLEREQCMCRERQNKSRNPSENLRRFTIRRLIQCAESARRVRTAIRILTGR